MYYAAGRQNGTQWNTTQQNRQNTRRVQRLAGVHPGKMGAAVNCKRKANTMGNLTEQDEFERWWNDVAADKLGTLRLDPFQADIVKTLCRIAWLYGAYRANKRIIERQDHIIETLRVLDKTPPNCKRKPKGKR